MSNNIILQKLNQFLATTKENSPNEWFNFNTILLQLKEWLAIIPSFFHLLSAKFGDLFSTLAHWLAVATPYMLAGVGVVLLCLLCFCCFSVIISCIASLACALWSIILGLLALLWSLIRWFLVQLWSLIRWFLVQLCSVGKFLWQMCGCCCRGSMKMMKAPGRGGNVFMPRALFEANPASYFIGLRAGRPV